MGNFKNYEKGYKSNKGYKGYRAFEDVEHKCFDDSGKNKELFFNRFGWLVWKLCMWLVKEQFI